jgi:TolB-like protein/tetratricopeptide (TPR) repeat protein
MTGAKSTANDASADDRRAAGDRLCIAFADVVGFSTLMNSDEYGAFRKWASLRDDQIKPSISAYSGQFVKSTGDGIIAAFGNTADAAHWAKDIQQSGQAGRFGLTLRIALNRCNVIRDGDDLIGDGVNIAARLQERAEPGGVIISDAAYQELSGENGFEFRELGKLRLKNIPKPVAAFDLVIEDKPAKRILESSIPSIAVMPFRNLGPGADHDYFAEGINEDIIVSLSGLKELVVISRGSSVQIGSRLSDPRDIGRALCVGYVLTGTLRRVADRVRITTELLDTTTAECLFAERREFLLSDLFEVQDNIVHLIVGRIAPNVREAEQKRVMRKRPDNFSAYDCYLKALSLMSGLDRQRFEQANQFLEQAMELDPNFAMAPAWAARWRTIKLGQGWSSDFANDAKIASELAATAISLDHENSLALATFGHVRSFAYRDYNVAVEYLERAVAACPSNAVAWMLYSATMCYLKHGKQAIEYAERALRLSPFDPHVWFYYTFIGFAHFAAENYEEAIKWCHRADAENPHYTSNLRILACALAGAGRLDEARAVGARLLELEPEFRIGPYIQSGRPYATKDARDIVAKQLSLAGIPG